MSQQGVVDAPARTVPNPAAKGGGSPEPEYSDDGGVSDADSLKAAAEAIKWHKEDEADDEPDFRAPPQDELDDAQTAADGEPTNDDEPKQDDEPDKPAAREESEDEAEAWAAIAAERKSAREQMAELKQLREQIDQERGQYQQLISKLKEDPVAFMDQVAGEGWYEHATQRILNKGKPGQGEIQKRATEESDSLRKELAELKEMLQQRDAKAEADQYWGEVANTLKDDKYELIREDPVAMAELESYIQGYAREYNKVLPPQAAADKILEAQRERLKKLRGTKSWQGLFGGPEPQAQPKQQSDKQGSGSITSDLDGRQAPVVDDDEQLTWQQREEARIRQAQSMIRWHEPV